MINWFNKITRIILRNKEYFLVGILLIFTVIAHIEWFNPASILTHGDWGRWPTDVTRSLFSEWSTWNRLTGIGKPNPQLTFITFMYPWSLIANLGFSYDTVSKIFILIPTSVLIVVSPYLLIKKLVGKKSIAFLGALIYSSTTYALSNQVPIHFVYAASPLVLYMLIFAFESHDYRRWLVFALTYSLLIGYEVRIAYLLTFVLISYSIVFYRHIFIGHYKYISLTISVILLINTYWIYPFIFGSLSGAVTEITNRGLFGENLFDMQHALAIFKWQWTGSIPNSSFIKQQVLPLFWTIPLLAFSSLFFLRKMKVEEKKKVVFFFILAALGIFLTKQSDGPFPGFYKWAYENLPTFSLFREASKFFIYTSLAYTVLAAYALKFVASSSKKIFIFLGFIVLASTMYFYLPLITKSVGDLYVSREAPPDFERFENILKRESVYSRVVWLPRESRWSYFNEKHPKAGAVDLISKWKGLYIENADRTNDISQNSLGRLFKNSKSAFNFEDISVKYVAIPVRDLKNNDDFFRDYGDDRQYYLDLLDTLPWLKKVDIGTKELAVYENQNFKPYFSASTQLYNLSSLSNLEQTFTFGQDQLKSDDFQFKLDDSKVAGPQTGLIDFFTELKRGELSSDGIKRQFATGADKDSLIYANNNRPVVGYTLVGGRLTLNAQKLAGPFIQEENSSLVQGTAVPIGSVPLSTGEYYVNTGSDLFAVDAKKPTRSLGVVTSSPRVLKAASQNLIPNASLESGPWQSHVDDCNNYDNAPQINQRMDPNDKTDGSQALILEADKHTACTGPDPITVTPGSEYQLQFDYKAEGGRQAGYEVEYIGSSTKPSKEYLYVQDNNWRQMSTLVKIPADTKQIRVTVKGIPDDRRKAHAMNWYDNFRLSSLTTMLDTQLNTQPQYNQTALEPAKNVNVKYESALTYQNMIANGSFEQGLWQNKVGDCNAYDDKAILDMSLTSEHSDGSKALELDATRHTACTNPAPVAVKENSKYLLSFDYQSPNADNAGYYVAFNDPARTVVSEQLPIKDAKWQNFTKTLTAPYGATSMQLVVYSYGSELGNTKVINRYDNFFATEVPDIADQYYLVSKPRSEVKAPAAIDFTLDSPTRKMVHVRGATTGFYLAMSEAYHPQWRLELSNKKVQGLGSWWPGSSVDAVSDADHIKLNDFQNGWWVDVEKLCAGGAAGCVKNADGTYDIDMVVEFVPQRWFYVGLIISGLTLAGCIGYLVWSWRRKKMEHRPMTKFSIDKT